MSDVDGHDEFMRGEPIVSPMDKHLMDYDRVTAELRTMHVEKVTVYGLGRYEVGPEDEVQLNLGATFYDVRRKYLRIKNIITTPGFSRTELTPTDLENLREEFRDLAGYGIVGVQQLDAILSELQGKKQPRRIVDRPQA